MHLLNLVKYFRKPAVFLQTKQVPTVMSLSLDLNSPGLFHFKDGFKPQQPFKVNFPAIRTDVEYHFVYTFLSDYLQVSGITFRFRSGCSCVSDRLIVVGLRFPAL